MNSWQILSNKNYHSCWLCPWGCSFVMLHKASHLNQQHSFRLCGELSFSGTGSPLWLAIDSEIKVFLCSTLLIHYFCFHVFYFLSGRCSASSLTSFHVQNFPLFPSAPFFLDLWSRPDTGLDGFCCP